MIGAPRDRAYVGPDGVGDLALRGGDRVVAGLALVGAVGRGVAGLQHLGPDVGERDVVHRRVLAPKGRALGVVGAGVSPAFTVTRVDAGSTVIGCGGRAQGLCATRASSTDVALFGQRARAGEPSVMGVTRISVRTGSRSRSNVSTRLPIPVGGPGSRVPVAAIIGSCSRVVATQAAPITGATCSTRRPQQTLPAVPHAPVAARLGLRARRPPGPPTRYPVSRSSMRCRGQ